MGFELRRRDVVLLAGLTGLALLGRRFLGSAGVAVGEASAFLAIGLLLWRHAGVRATLRHLDPLPRALALLLPGLLVAGQVAGQGDRLYPFVTWPLYTTSLRANPSYHEYTAALADGREIPLPVRAFFPTLGGRLAPFLEFLSGSALHAPVGPAGARATARLEAVLRTLAREHERSHPMEPVVAIDVWHRTVPTAGYEGRSSITRRHDRRVETP